MSGTFALAATSPKAKFYAVFTASELRQGTAKVLLTRSIWQQDLLLLQSLLSLDNLLIHWMQESRPLTSGHAMMTAGQSVCMLDFTTRLASMTAVTWWWQEHDSSMGVTVAWRRRQEHDSNKPTTTTRIPERQWASLALSRASSPSSSWQWSYQWWTSILKRSTVSFRWCCGGIPLIVETIYAACMLYTT